MKAIVCTQYGEAEVLKVKQVPQPKPKDDEVLIKVVAASITTADSMMRSGTPWFARLFLGWSKPKRPIPGTGFAGTIEAIGKDVTLHKVNDQIFGETSFEFGAHAEYLCLKQNSLIVKKPEALSFDELAPMCDGALTSYSFLSDIVNLQKEQRILINGAAGSLGTAAVQIAHNIGAHVTGVCSAANSEFIKSLGADEVIDYVNDDFTQLKNTYDIIFDTIGKSSYCACRSLLKPGGTYLSPVLSIKLLFLMLFTSFIGPTKAKFSATGMRPVKELKPLLIELRQLSEKGLLHTVISKRYALNQISEAHQHIEGGHKKGNVILKLQSN